MRAGLAAVFLDRRIFELADRADRRDDRVAVGRDVGFDRVAQRARARGEDLAGELVELDRVGERQRQRLRLGGERVAERAGKGVEPRVKRVVAGEGESQHWPLSRRAGRAPRVDDDARRSVARL